MATTELDELLGDLGGSAERHFPLLKLALAALLLVAAGAATYLLLLQGGGATATERTEVTVSRGPVVNEISLTGTLQTQSSAELSFGESGVVSAVHVTPGQEVKAGDLLAEVESDAVQEAVRQAQLNLEAGQIRLNQMLQGPSASDVASADQSVLQAEMALQEAEDAWQDLRDGPSEDEKLAADIALKQAEAQRKSAKANLDKLEDADASPSEISAAELSLDAADLGVTQARNDYMALRQPPTQAEIDAAQASIESAKAGLDSAMARRDELMAGADAGDIQLQQNQVQQLQLALETAQKRLDGTRIQAPFDGTVADIAVEAGDIVGLEAVAFTLHTPNNLSIELAVGDVDYADLEVGQKGFAIVDSLDGASYPIVLESLGTLPTSNQGVVTYTAVARIIAETGAATNGEGEAAPWPLPGMQAQVTLVVEQRLDVLTLPSAAVQQLGPAASVDVLNPDGTIETVPVTTGLDNGRTVEILSGLEEGQTVLLPQTSSIGGNSGGGLQSGEGGFFAVPGGGGGGEGPRIFEFGPGGGE